MKYSELVWTAVIAAFTVSMGAAPAAAKGGSSNAKVKPTVGVAAAKPATTTKARSSTVTAVPKTKAPAPRVKATSATKAKTSASPKVSSKPAAAKGATRPTATSAKRTEPKPSLATGPTAETKPTATGPTAPTVPLNKAQQLLTKNTNLRLKLQTRLGGMDPIAAASGFRNLGQFVAAVNVSSNNPGVQFSALKALMTGNPPMSLGQALQQLRGLEPATATTIANTALAQADGDILTSTMVVRKTTDKR